MRRFLSIDDRTVCCVAAVLLAAATGLAEMPQWYLDTGLSTVDTDGDGIPDVWERRTYGDPLVADSHLDRDGDGLTDLEEFMLGSDPRTFSTTGDFWSDSEKIAAGLDPLTRVIQTVDTAQWLAHLGWNVQPQSGWDAKRWLDWAAPDESDGFGQPYRNFVLNTPPYSGTNRVGTVDFWLKARTDRLALATVGDRLSTNTFLVLPGERRYRVRVAKDGPVSLTLDPLPGTLANIPGATNGLWICEMLLESAQPGLLVFTAGDPPHIPDPPSGLECLVVGEEAGEEPPADPAPDGGELPEPFHPLVGDLLRIDAVHERVTVSGDYGGIWCLCGCEGSPIFGDLDINAPGGATLDGEPISPDLSMLDAAGGIPTGTDVGEITYPIGSAKYPFLRRNVVIRYAVCQARGGIYGVEEVYYAGELWNSLWGGFRTGHEPGQYDEWPCYLRGCTCSGDPTTIIGFSHGVGVNCLNTRNLDHPDEPDEDKKYNHCLGILWTDMPFNLMNLVETFGIDLAAANCPIKWEIDGEPQDSSFLKLGDDEPNDLDPRVFRIKMMYVFPAGELMAWDRFILVVNNHGTKASFDSWYNRFSVETGWLAELPAAYSALGPWTTHKMYIPYPTGGGSYVYEYTDFSDPEPSTTNLWDTINTPGQFMHHVAKRQMRSRPTPGGHGHQACYDDEGIMYVYGVNAGTADYGATSSMKGIMRHIKYDVDPFIRALQLDGNPCLQSGTALTHAIIHQGGNTGKYLQCRPSIPNNKRRLLPGDVPYE